MRRDFRDASQKRDFDSRDRKEAATKRKRSLVNTFRRGFFVDSPIIRCDADDTPDAKSGMVQVVRFNGVPGTSAASTLAKHACVVVVQSIPQPDHDATLKLRTGRGMLLRLSRFASTGKTSG